MNFLIYTGLWIPGMITALAASYWGSGLSLREYLAVFAGAHIFPLYIWSVNLPAKRNGKTKFPLFPSRQLIAADPDYQISYRQRALQKPVPKSLLSKRPQGLIFGKYQGKYVRIIPGAKGAAHTLVLGGSGSGKTSSVLLSSILVSRDIHWIAVDVKGELTEKGFGRDNVLTFNPKDRGSYGFDFFSGTDNALESIRRIVYSLIPQRQQSAADSFWTDAPRAILTGLFLFAYQSRGCRTLPDLVDFVLSKPLKDLVNEVLRESRQNSIVYKQLVSFGGENAADETLSSLAMTVNNAISLIATDEDLRFLLRDSSRRISPEMCETHNIVLQISDEHLETYSPIFNAILSTFANGYLCRRPEGSVPIVLLIDELGRICGASGQIQGLQALLQIGRSRGITVMLALQSWAALKSVYPEGACEDMLTNLQYRVILQSQPDNKSLTDMAVSAFGKYKEQKRSTTHAKQQSTSYGFEDQDILHPDDLLSLPELNRVILISPHGSFMLQKTQYFKDKQITGGKHYAKRRT